MKKFGKLWVVAVIGLVVGVLGGAFANISLNSDQAPRTFQDRSYCFGTSTRC